MNSRLRPHTRRIDGAGSTPLWRRRQEFAPGAGPSPFGLLPIRPELIITELLRLRLEEPEEIIPEMGTHPLAGFQTAGVLDRELRRIVIARKFPLPCRRYTMLHEVGHYFLHPDVLYHRDMPLIGSERTELRGRPRLEVEADLFAAEVLMPKRLVCDLFVARYGGTISPDEIDENLAFKLSLGSGGRLTIDQLVQGTRRYRSRVLAMDTHAGRSFAELLLVSSEAMAIRLEELDLAL